METPTRTLSGAAGLFALTLLCLAFPLASVGPEAQRKKPRKPKLEKWQIDPYTKMDPKAMKKAGILSYGPFGFGDKTTTDQVAEQLGKAKIRWIETAHFKMGLDLSTWAIPIDRKIKAKITAELEELKATRLPKLKTRVKKLKPWLRVHLTAMRLEKSYEEFMKVLGTTDESFPKKPNVFVKGKYMGQGPYLGQPDKYTVLVTRKLSDFARYLQNFIGMHQEMAKRHNFKVAGSQLLATCEGLDQGRLRDDTAMHAHLVWNVTHNLINGYRFYTHDLPVWFTEGSAHWRARRITRKHNNFDQNESSLADLKSTWKWNVKVRQLVSRGKITPIPEMMQWRDFGQLRFNDHMVTWSLLDFIMKKFGDKGYRTYIDEMHNLPLDKVSGQFVAKDILGLQRKAMRKAFKMSSLQFAEKWKEYVLATYPLK